jgi:hypothetical protein
MADHRTPEEQAGMSKAEQERFPKLTTGQLNRRLIGWSLALVIMILIIIVMVIRG